MEQKIYHFKTNHRGLVGMAPTSPPAISTAATFEQIVEHYTRQLGNKAKAIRLSVKNHPDAHAHYVRRVQQGEIIKL